MATIHPIPTPLNIKHMALMALKPKQELEPTSLQKLRARREAERMQKVPKDAA